MKQHFLSLLVPPIFPDKEKNIAARLLYGLLELSFVFFIFSTFPMSVLVSGGENVLRVQGILGLGVCFMLMALVRRGIVRPAAYLYIGIFWIMTTVQVYLTGGIHASIFTVYLVLIFITGFVLGERAGMWLTGLSVLVGVIAAWAEIKGWFPVKSVSNTPITELISQVVLFVIAFWVQRLSIHVTRTALTRAQESERQYRNLLENIPVITYMNALRPAFHITFVSPQVEVFSGFTREVLLATPDLWFRQIHPDDQARVLAESRHVDATRKPFALNYRLITQDGKILWIHDEAVLVHDETGTPVYWLGVWTDITNTHETEIALAHERDLLQALMSNIPDMIYFKDAEARFTRINCAQARHLGVTLPEQTLGKTELDWYPQTQNFYEEELTLLKTGIPVVDRLENHQTNHGEPRWISATKVPLRDPQGQIVGLVGISRDVTDRELTRQMLEKQAAELATVIKVSAAVSTILVPGKLLQTIVELTQTNFALYHVQIYLLTEDGQTLKIHAGAGAGGWKIPDEQWAIPVEHPQSIVAQVARAGQGALINNVHTAHFLPNPFLPDTQSELAVPIQVGDYLLGVFDLQSEKIDRFHTDDLMVFMALAQQIAVALQNARRYELAQTEIAFRKRVEDILRSTEQLFRAAIEAADAVPYSLKYGEETYTFMGEGITRLIGYAPEEITSHIWTDLIEETVMLGEGKGLSRQEAIQETRQGHLNIWRADYRVRTRDGRTCWLADASVQLRDEREFPLGAIGILQDITARKQVEEALQKLNLELERRVEERTAQLAAANKELESFTYTVSHDLRAPVRAMVGFTAILLEEYAFEIPLGAQRYLQHIRTGAERLGQLVDGLLTFTRLGRQPIIRHQVDMKGLAQQVFYELLEVQLGRRAILTLGDLPFAEADPALIRQLFERLLENAFKYSQAEPETQIQIGFQQEQDETIYFVKDNGIGFDMQYAHKLFGVFQQLHVPGEYEGIGIGLALSKRIIEKHGGLIWAEAEPGAGAVFYFTVPLFPQNNPNENSFTAH